MIKSQEEKFGKFKTPFEAEDLRTNLAQKGNYQAFLKTYSSNYPVITASNTSSFWDKKFDSLEKFENQDSMTREKIDFIISLLPEGKSKMLDVGLGQAYLEQRLKKLGTKHNLYGIDISKKSITRARKNFDGEFIVGDILKNKKIFKKSFYDVIVAIEVTEHIPPAKIFEFYKRIHNSLRPKGIFIISTPLNEGLRYSKINPSAHLREYTIPILKAEFKLAGFKITQMKTFFAFSKFYTLKKLLARLLRRWEANNIVVKAVKV